MKEYITSVKRKIGERNFLSNEYYKNKIYLNDRKNKKIVMEPSQWDLNKEMCQKLGLDVDFVSSNPNFARKFMFSDETKRLREYGDLFALFN